MSTLLMSWCWRMGGVSSCRCFRRAGLPLSLVLLLDTSASVRHVFRNVQDAAVRFLRELQPRDTVSVIVTQTIRLSRRRPARKAQDTAVFVLPAHKDTVSVRVGDTVWLDGVVLQMPRHIDDKLKAPAGSNDKIYVYATNVNK